VLGRSYKGIHLLSCGKNGRDTIQNRIQKVNTYGDLLNILP